MPIPFPGYTTNKPMLQAIRDLKQELGLNDSYIQITEVALRYLIECAEHSDQDTKEYVNALSKKYSISQGSNNFDELKLNSSRSYIVQTYNIVELFFRNLNQQYKDHKCISANKWIKQKDKKNIDPFNQLIANFSNIQREYFENTPEKELLEYYRLVRNSIVHNTDKSVGKAMKYYKENILKNLAHFSNYTLSAPNTPDKLCYDDFVLYTRALKYFSNIISEACDIKASEIYTVSIVSSYHKGVKKLYHKHNPSTVKKVAKSAKLYYQHNYGDGKLELEDFLILTFKDIGISSEIYRSYFNNQIDEK